MTRYYVTTDDRGEREVSMDEFVQTERAAGFRPKYPDRGRPCTGGFSSIDHGRRLEGRIDYTPEETP